MCRKRKAMLLMALVGAAVLIPLIVETDETTKHLKAIQRIYVEANPNAYGWSFDKFRLAFRERRPPEDWSKELEYHRGKLVEIGYFEVIELPIPDKESLKQFALLVDQQSTNFQCTYWSYSSQTGMVRVTAFKGDLPIWRRIGEEARRGGSETGRKRDGKEARREGSETGRKRDGKEAGRGGSGSDGGE